MTIAQQLKIKDFPFTIYDKQYNPIYLEDSTGYWSKHEYNSKGEYIYFENSNGDWIKREYCKGKKIYYEDSDGIITDNRPKPVEVELSMYEIATKFGIDVNLLKIKK